MTESEIRTKLSFGDVKHILLEYQCGINQLEAALESIASTAERYADDDRRLMMDVEGLVIAIRSALSIRDVHRAINQDINAGVIQEAHFARMAANRLVVNDTLGAAGNWGHEHPIGEALSALYRVNLGPLQDCEDGDE